MPILILEHGDRPGSTGILGTALREYGHAVRHVMVGTGETVPADLDDVDAIIATDGPQTLTDAASTGPTWLLSSTSLLKAAHEREMPIIGLGFGARLLAKALGGEVAMGGACGWFDCTLTPTGREHPLFAGVLWTSPQLVWQVESISALPAGASGFAQAGPRGQKPVLRGFNAGVFSFGFEHRWELDEALVERLIATRGAEASAAGASPAAIRSGWREHGELSQRIGRRIAENIALYLMPVDRLATGRTKDLHY